MFFFNMKKILITGGAGFIGSNLVHELLKDNDNQIYVFDNLSTGRKTNLPINNPKLMFCEIDLLTDFRDWPVIKDLNHVYHFAANADIRGGILNREIDLKQNLLVTKSVCDYARISKCEHFVFASSAAVYGEPAKFPTSEIEFLKQTSIYGASKLACEAFIQAYSEYGDFKSSIFRFVSWIGVGYSHGVIYDFYKKLKNDSEYLEILGDGSQRKSFLDVSDGVKGIIKLIKHDKTSEIFNLGHYEIMSVKDLADIVCKSLSIKGIKYKFSGTKRGWIGDSPLVHLDISKARSFGWEPKVSIKQGIINTINFLKKDNKYIDK